MYIKSNSLLNIFIPCIVKDQWLPNNGVTYTIDVLWLVKDAILTLPALAVIIFVGGPRVVTVLVI